MKNERCTHKNVIVQTTVNEMYVNNQKYEQQKNN